LAALPFATGFFDAATSQFGIEYADRGALVEAVRVLKPGGRGLFLLHHAGGIIFEACRTRLQAHRHVLPDDTSFRLAHAVFAQLARGVRPRMIVNDVAQFRAAVNGMARRFAGSGPESNMREAIAFLIDLARAPDRFEPRDALRRLDFVQADIAAWAARQQAMLAAALDDGGIAAVKTALAEAGAVLDPVELCRSESSAVIAWKLAFRKSEP
jgi:SAM-dependent methyltransferase